MSLAFSLLSVWSVRFLFSLFAQIVKDCLYLVPLSHTVVAHYFVLFGSPAEVLLARDETSVFPVFSS